MFPDFKIAESDQQQETKVKYVLLRKKLLEEVKDQKQHYGADFTYDSLSQS